MQQVQQRARDYLDAVVREAAGRIVALVSHCDVIRAVIAGIPGLSLDRLLRFEIAPASISRLEGGEWGARLQSVTEVAV